MSGFGSSIPKSIKVSLPTDEEGMVGRECPEQSCLGYFKIRFGTGLKGIHTCYCPYCGHQDSQKRFWTPDQLNYIQSVGVRAVTDALIEDLKSLEFDHPARGSFGIGMSLKVKPGDPVPIRHYREKKLQTEVVCSVCTLHFAIYGVFGYCPDCGNHNSLFILQKNLEFVAKELDLAANADDKAFAEHLIGDALENVVSAFDGFGRQACQVMQPKAVQPNALAKLSFQNVLAADQQIQQQFSIRLSSLLTSDQWQLVVRCFQKRHLLSHKMGVIDAKYVAVAGDPGAVVGRKVAIEADEVRTLIVAAGDLAQMFANTIGLQTRTIDPSQVIQPPTSSGQS
jgi:hypothetical protein